MGSGTPTWLLGYPAWAERFPDVHHFWLPAAALRAAADQVLPLYMCSLGSTRGTARLGVRQKLIAIAAELEGTDG